MYLNVLQKRLLYARIFLIIIIPLKPIIKSPYARHKTFAPKMKFAGRMCFEWTVCVTSAGSTLQYMMVRPRKVRKV